MASTAPSPIRVSILLGLPVICSASVRPRGPRLPRRGSSRRSGPSSRGCLHPPGPPAPSTAFPGSDRTGPSSGAAAEYAAAALRTVASFDRSGAPGEVGGDLRRRGLEGRGRPRRATSARSAAGVRASATAEATRARSPRRGGRDLGSRPQRRVRSRRRRLGTVPGSWQPAGHDHGDRHCRRWRVLVGLAAVGRRRGKPGRLETAPG